MATTSAALVSSRLGGVLVLESPRQDPPATTVFDWESHRHTPSLVVRGTPEACSDDVLSGAAATPVGGEGNVQPSVATTGDVGADSFQEPSVVDAVPELAGAAAVPGGGDINLPTAAHHHDPPFVLQRASPEREPPSGQPPNQASPELRAPPPKSLLGSSGAMPWADFRNAVAAVSPSMRCHGCLIMQPGVATAHGEGVACPTLFERCGRCLDRGHLARSCPRPLNVKNTCFRCCLPGYVIRERIHPGKTPSNRAISMHHSGRARSACSRLPRWGGCSVACGVETPPAPSGVDQFGKLTCPLFVVKETLLLAARVSCGEGCGERTAPPSHELTSVRLGSQVCLLV